MTVLRRLLVALVWMPLLAWADPEAIGKLTPLLAKTQTLQGHFSQVTLDSRGDFMQEVKGEMVLKRPGLLRWHSDAPAEQLLVSNGQKVWLYDPDLKTVTVQSLDQRLSSTPVLLLSGDVSQIDRNFDVSYREGGNLLDFTLKPKSKDSLFNSLRLSFRGGVISEMQLIDTSGQRTNIIFMGVEMNLPVKSSEFEFQAPPGVDVIEN